MGREEKGRLTRAKVKPTARFEDRGESEAANGVLLLTDVLLLVIAPQVRVRWAVDAARARVAL